MNLGELEIKTEFPPSDRQVSRDIASSSAKSHYKDTLENMLDNIAVPDAVITNKT